MHKNRSKRIVKYGLLSVMMMFMCVLSIFLIVNDLEVKVKINKKLAEEYSGSFIKVTDNYDRARNESFSSFMERDDSLARLQNLYNDFISSEILDYYEIAVQPVELTGEYIFADSFLYNDQAGLKNQETIYKNGEKGYVTPVKAIQMGRETLYKLGVEQYFEDTIQFSEEDFLFQDNIPVILGYHYKEYCRVGDVIEGRFLTENVNFVVKGFFRKDAVFSFYQQSYDLNHFFFVPLGNLVPSENLAYKDIGVILYSVKNAGYLSYNSAENYRTVVKELERAARKNGLEYTFIPDMALLAETAAGTAGWLTPASALAFFLFNLAAFVVLLSMGKKIFLGAGGGRRKLVRYVTLSVLLFAVDIYLACNLSMNYFKDTIYLILFLQKINGIIIWICINYLAVAIVSYLVAAKGQRAHQVKQ